MYAYVAAKLADVNPRVTLSTRVSGSKVPKCLIGQNKKSWNPGIPDGGIKTVWLNSAKSFSRTPLMQEQQGNKGEEPKRRELIGTTILLTAPSFSKFARYY